MKMGQTEASSAAAYNSFQWPTDPPSAPGKQLTVSSISGGLTQLGWADPTGIPWTLKGQLAVGTGPGTFELLNPSPTNGRILVSDSSTITGLAYTDSYVPTLGPTTAALLPVGTALQRPTASLTTGGIRYNSDTGILEYSNGAAWIPVGSGSGGFAVDITVTPPIPGIDLATNVQRALEAIELQVQDRIEFVVPTTPGIQASVSVPISTSNDGTTLSLGLDSASTTQPGIVQLTNDVTGTSQTLAITQQAASVMNAQIQALTGGNILAGTYDSNTGTVVNTTTAGAAAGFVAGLQAPLATTALDNYYLLVTVSGNQGPPGATIPGTGVQSGDWFIVQDDGGVATWITIDFENVVVAASQVTLAPVTGLTAANVQQGIQQLTVRTDATFTNVISTVNGITVTNTTTAPFGKQAAIQLNPATATDIGGVYVVANTGLNLSPAGQLSLAPPQPGGAVLGGVKTQPGSGILIDAAGNISATGGGGGGSVSSVTVAGTNGIASSGSPITSSGTITVSLDISNLPPLP